MANKRGSKIKSWCWGNKAFEITQTFKEHRNAGGLSKRCAGLDVGTSMGTDLFTKEAGIVFLSYTGKKYGCQVITIKHKNCFREYVHLSRRFVKVGQKVKKGHRICKSGSSGLSSGSHTHYALLKGTNYKTAKRVDPYADLVSKPKPKPKPKPDPCQQVKKDLKAQRARAESFAKRLDRAVRFLKNAEDEVKKLRGVLVERDRQVWELKKTITSLTTEATIGRKVIQLASAISRGIKKLLNRILEPLSGRRSIKDG